MPKPGGQNPVASGSAGTGVVTGRGQSPVLHNHGHPMKVQNSRELQVGWLVDALIYQLTMHPAYKAYGYKAGLYGQLPSVPN